MHQHSRPPPPSASPAISERTNPTRTNNSRDRDTAHLRSNSANDSGSSEDFINARQDTSADPAVALLRLNQVIQNFHHKAALVVLHTRFELPAAYDRKGQQRVNKWFNIDSDETEEFASDIRAWRKIDVQVQRPPPMVIEVFLTCGALPQGRRLVWVDDDQKRWEVTNALDVPDTGPAKITSKIEVGGSGSVEIALERWTVELGPQTEPLPAELVPLNSMAYRNGILQVRSLYTTAHLMPAYTLARSLRKSRSGMKNMWLSYRIVDGSRHDQAARVDNLTTPLDDSGVDPTKVHDFGVSNTPAGPIAMKVRYRENCNFRIDNADEYLSARFLGADVDDMFRPSVPYDGGSEHKIGSLPNDSRTQLVEQPELGLVYGSLGTFHQAGIGAGTSPISTLRHAKEFLPSSPSPDLAALAPLSSAAMSSRRGSTARPGPTTTGRRSSFTFQPFKTPALSASPLGVSPLSSSPRASAARVPQLSSLTEEARLASPDAQIIVARRSSSLASDPVPPGSTGSSPKPAVTRYSSSFSHRRQRLSSDARTRGDDDGTSSGRGSVTSSAAPPGSGLMVEAAAKGDSSGSMHDDDGENISDFLKMLDLQKDLLHARDAASTDASTKRTTAALNRFRHMRDSNAALSDSMSSSMLQPKSSNESSRQLPGRPTISTSSSPGKPVSPHTPHTPFAPSRLSAAYSHDDDEEEQPRGRSEEHAQDSTSEGTTQTQSHAHVPAIDIPSSPRPAVTGTRRSISVQRGPPSPDDDLGDVFGVRAASLGAQDEKGPKRDLAQGVVSDVSIEGRLRQQPEMIAPRRSSTNHKQTEPLMSVHDATSESASPQASALIHRSRLARGSGRGQTPPQSSLSSFGAGGSVERGDSGSASGSWGRGTRLRSSSRPDNVNDDDEYLPFAMEKSDFGAGDKKGG